MYHQNRRAEKYHRHTNRKLESLRKRPSALELLEPRMLLSTSLLRDTFSYPQGDFNNANLTLNAGASISNLNYQSQLQLADGGTSESRSTFTNTQYAVSSFTTNFNVEFSGPSTSGFAFVIQSANPTAVGSGKAGSDGIAKSVALEFLATSSGTETLLNVNGVSTTPSFISPSTIDLSNARDLLINVEYTGTTLKVTETDNQNTLTPVIATQTYTGVNIAAATGANAYFGFTGADTSTGVTQVLQSWEFANNPPADTDIGAPSAAGSSTYSTGGNYAVSGAGTGAGSTSDQLHFLNESITGDTTMLAQLNTPTSGSAAEGVMLRASTAASSAFAEVDLTASGAQFISRSTTGAAATVSTTVPASGAQWLELVRNGPSVSGYISTSSSGPWTLVGTGPVTGPASALIGLAVASGSSSTLATANFSGVTVDATTSIGVDTAPAVPSSPSRGDPYQPIWVNIIKQSTGFFQAANSGTPVSVDANGWPTADFQLPSITVVAEDEGVWSFSMNVSQNPNVRVFSASLSNGNYNATTQTYTANITISAPGRVAIVVTNTGSGAQNIQLIRPGYSTTNPPVFATSYINFFQSLHPTVLRFMNWTQTNGNPVQNWADRTLPSGPTQTETATLYNYDGSVDYTGANTGTAWEYAIILANEVHADMWINVPGQATDDYITQLANLIKNGDTVNGVSYPALDPDLNVYIEYSNETWNAGNEVYGYTVDAAVAEVNADDAAGTPSNLNYDNLTYQQADYGVIWQQRWIARRMVQISNIFGTVFGQGAINTRIRPELSDLSASQLSNQLTYINTNYGAPSNYVYALASIFYANMDGPNNSTNTLNGGNGNPNLSVRDVMNDLSANSYYLATEYASLGGLAKQYGLSLNGYESGTDLSGFQDTLTSKIQAETSPYYTTFLEQYYQDWYSNGGGTIIYYDGGIRPWGVPYGDFQISDSQSDLFNAKEIGFRDVSAMERPSPLPAALTSLTATDISSTQVNLNWSSTASGAIEYRVEASPSSTYANNVVTQIAPASATSWSFSGLSPAVTYYFQVIAASQAGDAAPSPSATAATPGTLPIPAAPTNVSAVAVSPSQINISWADSSLIETGFAITVATDANFNYVVQTLSAVADATSVAVYSLNEDTTYYVRVVAGNSSGGSAAVAAAPVTTTLAVPLAQYNFNEGSGPTVVDSGTGTPADGTIAGGVTRVGGPNFGSALNFDGSTGLVNLGTPAKLNLEGQITVRAWINTTSASSPDAIISQDFDGIDRPFFFELTNPTTVNFGTYRFSGNGDTVEATGTSATPLTDGKWHLLVGVYDGQDFRVYIDGTLAGSAADPYGITQGTANTYIGYDTNNNNGKSQYFNGSIADVEIYPYALSAANEAQASQPGADTWTGAVSSSWSSAQNWSAGETPGPQTNVVISTGTVTASSDFNIGSLTLTGGTLQFATGIGGSTVTSLTLSGGAKLDLANDHLIINYGALANDPRATIVKYLSTGSDDGLWNGLGITSSTAAANSSHYGVGYADGADGIDPSLISGQLELAYALDGDITLQGLVNGNDFALLAAKFGKNVTGGWAQGDFNYDGIVNGNDFALLAGNFGKSSVGTAVIAAQPTQAPVFATQSLVSQSIETPTATLRSARTAAIATHRNVKR
jgi:hypothetical protein